MSMFSHMNQQVGKPSMYYSGGNQGMIDYYKEEQKRNEYKPEPFTRLLPAKMRGPAIEAVMRSMATLSQITQTGQTPEEEALSGELRGQTMEDYRRIARQMGGNLGTRGAGVETGPTSRYQSLAGSLLNSMAMIDAQRKELLRGRQLEASQMQIGNISTLAGRGQLVRQQLPQANPGMQAAGAYAGQAIGAWMNRNRQGYQGSAAY